MNVVRFLVVSGLLIFSISTGLAGPEGQAGVTPAHPSVAHAIADGPYPPVPVSSSIAQN